MQYPLPTPGTAGLWEAGDSGGRPVRGAPGFHSRGVSSGGDGGQGGQTVPGTDAHPLGSPHRPCRAPTRPLHSLTLAATTPQRTCGRTRCSLDPNTLPTGLDRSAPDNRPDSVSRCPQAWRPSAGAGGAAWRAGVLPWGPQGAQLKGPSTAHAQRSKPSLGGRAPGGEAQPSRHNRDHLRPAREGPQLVVLIGDVQAQPALPVNSEVTNLPPAFKCPPAVSRE